MKTSIRFSLLFFLILLFVFISPSFASEKKTNLQKLFDFEKELVLDLSVLFEREDQNNFEKFREPYLNALALVKTYYVADRSVEELVYESLHGVMRSLDPYCEFLTEENLRNLTMKSKGEYVGVGLVIGYRQDEVTVISTLEATPASHAGIRSGDVIEKINDMPVKKMSFLEVVDALRGEEGTEVSVLVFRQNEPHEFLIKREKVNIESVGSLELLPQEIAYLRVFDFDQNSPQLVEDRISEFRQKKLKGMILDLRQNPGGLLSSALETTDLFVEKNRALMELYKRYQDEDNVIYSEKKNTFKNKPLVILIDSGTASGAEVLASALKTYDKALLIGQKTFGKGSIQMVVPIGNNLAIRMTVGKFRNALGKEIDHLGVEPKIEILDNTVELDNHREGFPKQLQDQAVFEAFDAIISSINS